MLWILELAVFKSMDFATKRFILKIYFSLTIRLRVWVFSLTVLLGKLVLLYLFQSSRVFELLFAFIKVLNDTLPGLDSLIRFLHLVLVFILQVDLGLLNRAGGGFLQDIH